MTLQQMTIKSYRAAMREAALRYRYTIRTGVFNGLWNSRISVAMATLRTAMFYRSLARKLEQSP